MAWLGFTRCSSRRVRFSRAFIYASSLIWFLFCFFGLTFSLHKYLYISFCAKSSSVSLSPSPSLFHAMQSHFMVRLELLTHNEDAKMLLFICTSYQRLHVHCTVSVYMPKLTQHCTIAWFDIASSCWRSVAALPSAYSIIHILFIRVRFV